MGGEHRHLVGFRVTLEHRQLARGQLVLVLIDVLRSDGEQWLLAGERIRQEARGIRSTGIGRQAASPGWDGTIGITGHFCADRGQGGTQLRGFVRRNRRHHTARQQRHSQCAGLQQGFGCFHLHILPQNSCSLRSSYRS